MRSAGTHGTHSAMTFHARALGDFRARCVPCVPPQQIRDLTEARSTGPTPVSADGAPTSRADGHRMTAPSLLLAAVTASGVTRPSGKLLRSTPCPNGRQSWHRSTGTPDRRYQNRSQVRPELTNRGLGLPKALDPPRHLSPIEVREKPRREPAIGRRRQMRDVVRHPLGRRVPAIHHVTTIAVTSALS